MKNKNTKNSRPTFFMRRKEIRLELLKHRILDNDNTEVRMRLDANKVDSQLAAEGYKLEYQTEWARTRAIKYPYSAQQADMAGFESMEVC